MNARRLAWLFILLAGLMLNTGQGWADTWQHAVSSQISTEYETNPAMSTTYQSGVWRALFEPSYTLMGGIGANELKAGLALKLARSSNKILSVDRDDPSIFFNWSRQSEAGELGVTTKYAETATRYAGIDATGPINIDGTRASRTLSGRWSKALSDRSTLSADGAYEGVFYKGGGTYVDYSTLSGGLKFSYAWSERSTPFLKVSGDKYTPTGGGPSSRHANATLGFNWKVEYLDLTMQIGESKRSGGATDPQYGVTAQYTGQRIKLALNADRQIISSGLGNFVKADHVKGGWSYALSEHSNAGVDLDWMKNNSLTISSTNTNTNTSVWLQRNLSPLWSMRTYYLHRTIKGGVVDSVSSNILGLALIYTHSGF